MEHKSYVDIVKMISSTDWGRKFESDEEAQRSLLSSVDLTSACLLRILQKIDLFIEAMTREAIHEKLNTLRRRSEKALDQFILEKEEIHGNCPDIVKVYFKQSLFRRIGHHVWAGFLPSEVFVTDLPNKGTPARKAYDRWMKSKPKPQSKDLSEKEPSE